VLQKEVKTMIWMLRQQRLPFFDKTLQKHFVKLVENDYMKTCIHPF
jgi:hypothetical protein